MQQWKEIAFQKGAGLTDRYSVHIQCHQISDDLFLMKIPEIHRVHHLKKVLAFSLLTLAFRLELVVCTE